MGFAEEAPVKRDRKEEEEAFRKWMNDKVTQDCAKYISKLIECETHMENFFLFPRCRNQKKELADCCVQLSDAVLEKMKREYAQHPKEGKGPAKP